MENQYQTEEIVENQTEKNNGKEQLSNYFQYVMQVLKEPEYLLTDREAGKHQFGLITIGVFLALVLISSFIGILNYTDALRYFGFGDYFNYVERTISYGVALVLLIILFKQTSVKKGKTYDQNFFYEKLGAMLVLPSVLLVISIPLELLDVTIYSWFSGLAYTFLYLAVFLVSYLFIEKNNLKTAVLFVAGFYFVYRIIYLIL